MFNTGPGTQGNFNGRGYPFTGDVTGMTWQYDNTAGGYGHVPFYQNAQPDDPGYYEEQSEEGEEGEWSEGEVAQPGNNQSNNGENTPSTIPGLGAANNDNGQSSTNADTVSATRGTPQHDKPSSWDKAQELRERLMAAKRSRGTSTPGTNTPEAPKLERPGVQKSEVKKSGPKNSAQNQEGRKEPMTAALQNHKDTRSKGVVQNRQTNSQNDLDDLLAEGKAAAEAQAKARQDALSQNGGVKKPHEVTSQSQKAALALTAPRPQHDQTDPTSEREKPVASSAATPDGNMPVKPQNQPSPEGHTQAGQDEYNARNAPPKDRASTSARHPHLTPIRSDSNTDIRLNNMRMHDATQAKETETLGKASATPTRTNSKPSTATPGSAMSLYRQGERIETQIGTRAETRLESTERSVQSVPKNAAAFSNYFNDLDEWLEYTGYHDVAYRRAALHQFRALAELDEQRARILSEGRTERADKGYIAGPGSRIDRPESSRAVDSARSASVMAMPPPRRPSPVLAIEYPSRTGVNDGLQNTQPSNASTKRHRSPPSLGQERAEKHVRLNSAGKTVEVPKPDQNNSRETSRSHGRVPSGEFRIRGANEEEPDSARAIHSRPPPGNRARSHSPRTLSHRISMPQLPTSGRRLPDGDLMASRAHTARAREHPSSLEVTPVRRPVGRPHSPPPPHSRGRGDLRDSDPYGYRRHSPDPYFHGRPAPRDAPVGRPKFSGRPGDTRFFMIKSWNFDNVECSQREGTWATQPHNGDILADAFNACKNVILVFSVNKSMAFQGYARMESLPGPAPVPKWAAALRWPCSPPFFIRWITIAPGHGTPFRLVGHLKNSYNENQAVLVGRDGQEIEESCGHGLCEILDEETRK